jgi:hypothetical protein
MKANSVGINGFYGTSSIMLPVEPTETPFNVTTDFVKTHTFESARR